MKKVIKFALVAVLALSLNSCTDAEMSKIGGYGDKFQIEVINCDGSVSRTYISTGKVLSEANSDGYFFTDSKTGKLVEITGRLIITRL